MRSRRHRCVVPDRPGRLRQGSGGPAEVLVQAGVSEHPLGATFAGVLLFVIGLGIAGGVYQIDVKERRLRRGWVRAEGTVVQVVKRQTADGPVFAPLIVFQADSGARVSFTARVSKESQQHAIGEKIAVLYPPQEPEHAEIDYAHRRLIRNLLAAAGALVLLALGGTVAWQASRLQRGRMASQSSHR
ncbi:MAG: hypothetical protein DMF84_03490 [Acidobacteria bacterium]|nr:MAG: hypothetical protein DMF84_03490 [Acidobacteriota bacterium]